MPKLSVTQVADGVHLAGTGLVNWVLLSDGRDVVLVDAGYPGDHERVVASLEAIGRRVDDLAAILVTHAHVDHVGSVPRLLAQRPVPVLTSEVEAGHARRERLEQATERDVALAAARSPRVLLWSLRIVMVGATKHVTVDSAAPCATGVPLDLPGRPVPVLTPGHTSGHTMFHLPEVGALVTGDALVTGHPTTDRRGPQLLLDLFHHDPVANARVLDTVTGLSGDVVLPGHGPVWRGAYADAVARARA
jgi:glyoxylase-like metal-dependent hydrolase (beta-lactamase superfamily II)